jgi:hypothetical protein
MYRSRFSLTLNNLCDFYDVTNLTKFDIGLDGNMKNDQAQGQWAPKLHTPLISQ